MGILKQIFGSKEKTDVRPATGEIEAPCPHTSLTQHWDLPEQIGDAEAATYTCDSCSETFSFAEAQAYLHKAPELFPTDKEKEEAAERTANPS